MLLCFIPDGTMILRPLQDKCSRTETIANPCKIKQKDHIIQEIVQACIDALAYE